MQIHTQTDRETKMVDMSIMYKAIRQEQKEVEEGV